MISPPPLGGARGGLCPPRILGEISVPPQRSPPDLRENFQDFREFLPKSMKIIRKLDLVTEKAKIFRLRRAKKAKYLQFRSFSEFWPDLGGPCPPQNSEILDRAPPRKNV